MVHDLPRPSGGHSYFFRLASCQDQGQKHTYMVAWMVSNEMSDSKQPLRGRTAILECVSEVEADHAQGSHDAADICKVIACRSCANIG